ncbi:Cyclin-J18 [Zea mays]|uniref:Cyclin-J18 n=1 Tax=Zea mays TaxID=4577 RepID=A0A1D6JVH0_MAIZE|nr:Cyclin-J18 [Zea mays]
MSVKSLKALGDRIIADQHFMCRDFASAELVFLEVVEHNIGFSSICFIYLEELLMHFRLLHMLYQFLSKHGSFQSFLGLRFATSYDEEEIMKIVLTILLHVLKLDGIEEKGKGRFDARCLS